MIELKKKGNVYKIPVFWEVCDYVEVRAENLEQAYNYVVDNADDIPLGTEPEYVEGSYDVGDIEEVYVLNG